MPRDNAPAPAYRSHRDFSIWSGATAKIPVARGKIADNETSDGQPLGQHVTHHRRRPFGNRSLRVVILGDQAAHGYAREGVEQWKHRLEHRAANILEINVDAFRAGFLEPRREVGIAMIDAIIETELAFDVVAFFPAAGDPDGTRALDPGDLPDRRADGARGRGHHDGFARLRLPDIQ